MLLASELPSNEPKSTSLSQFLSTLPKVDKTYFVSTFVRDQRVHAKTHVLEGRVNASHWDRVASVGEGEVQAREPDNNAFGTPVLKPRVPRKTMLDATRAPLNYHRNGPGSPDTSPNECLPHPTKKEKKRKRPDSAVAAKRSLRISNQESRAHSNKLQPKNPDSNIEVKDGQALRRRERRDRKRAKRAIVNPTRSSDVENEPASDAKATKTVSKNARAKVPAGFALMHGFTATNVGPSRLTINPHANIGVFNQGKASVKTITNHKYARKGRQSTGFSELGFLNSGVKRRSTVMEKRNSKCLSSDTDNNSQSSDQGPKEQYSKFVITSRKPPETRHSVSRKTTPRSLSGNENENESNMSVDSRPPISHPIQARSSPDPLPQGTHSGSVVWDIEFDQASLLSRTLPLEKRSVMLEIRNRCWNDSPVDDLAGLDDFYDRPAVSAQSKMLAEKVDNAVEAKSPSPSLGPSQSASQHGRYLPPTDGTLPQADACSKYFISKAAPAKGRTSLEAHPFKPAPSLANHTENIAPVNHLEVISTHSRLSAPVSQANGSSRARYFGEEVTDHRLFPQDLPEPDIAPCLHASLSTESPTFCSLQPLLCEVQPKSVGSELAASEYASGRDVMRSVDYNPYDRHMCQSVDYDGLHPLRHSGCDLPEDFVECYSYASYDMGEHYLYHDYAGSGRPREPGFNVDSRIPEYDLNQNPDYGECTMDPALKFVDNGVHGLATGHLACWNLCSDRDIDRQYDEYVDDRRESLELDDTWNQYSSDILDAESHIKLSNTGANDLDNSDLDTSSLCHSEPAHLAIMFSQGRALLSGSTQEDGHTTTGTQTGPRQPLVLLSLVEADVAKSLRNHWLPQKL